MNVLCLSIILFYYSVTIAPTLFQYRPVVRESAHVLLLPLVLLPFLGAWFAMYIFDFWL